MNVAIIGLGYVGITLSKAILSAGHRLVGVDIDQKRIDELDDLGIFEVSADYEIIKNCEVVLIAVPTPLDERRKPDLSFLNSAVSGMKPFLTKGSLIVNESTSFPGTLREVIASELGSGFLYASAPERVDPGNKAWNPQNTPRIIGGLTSEAAHEARNFYQTFTDNVHLVSSPEVAEAAKLFENTFRQVNIALVNEFAQVAHALGISTTETLEAASTKPFGFMSFTPSVGVGGHCIPVDPSYLSFAADRAGVKTKFIDLANQVNLAMPEYLAARVDEESGGSIKGMSIQVSGIAYKSDVSDLRESPALPLIRALRSRGANVSWHDDLVGSWNSENSVAIKKVDIGIIVTAHSGVDYTAWKNGQTKVIDVSTSTETGWPKYL